jgi:hypothetical protein
MIQNFAQEKRVSGFSFRFKRWIKNVVPLKNGGQTGVLDLNVLRDRVSSYIGKGRENLLELEKAGLQAVPFNYYSPIPSVNEIEKGWETREAHPFFEPEIYHEEEMRRFLERELMPYSKEFSPDKDGSEDQPAGFYWNNPAYGYSDAMSLYCFIRYLRPRRVLEIGGGFSTLIIDQAMKKNGQGEIWEVEPYPKPFLRKIGSISRFYEIPAQDLPLDLFGKLEANDILFIDSTHTVKASSDCTFIYLKALKRLKQGVYIHSHDVFLPDSLPIRWNLDFQYYWTEHYLLQALLTGNEGFKVVYGSHYHSIYNGDLLEEFMDNKAGIGGGSFWYKRTL